MKIDVTLENKSSLFQGAVALS